MLVAGRPLWFHRALHTGVDGIERRRAADVKPVSLLTAEAQIGDSFGYVDLTEQFSGGRVAAHAVLVRIAPTDGKPNSTIGVSAHAIRDAGLRHVRKDLAVRHFARADIQVEYTDMRRIVGPVGEAGVDDIELLLVGREGNYVGLNEVIDH